MSLGGSSVSGQATAIVDTGTSLIAAAPAAASSIMSKIGAQSMGDGTYEVSCSRLSSLPILTFVISGVSFSLPASSYIIEVRKNFKLEIKRGPHTFWPRPGSQETSHL